MQNEVANKLRATVVRMRNMLLTRAFNKWSEAVQFKRYRKEKLGQAVVWWNKRQQGQAWNAWRHLMEMARENTELARQHARKMLRPLMGATFYGWTDHYAAKAAKRERAASAHDVLQRRRRGRMLKLWRSQVQARKQRDTAFGLIMR